MTQLTPEDKKKIYDILAKAYIEIVAEGKIGKVEKRVLAKKILDMVGKAKEYIEIHNFIQELMKYYPDFKNSSVIIDEPIHKLHEEQVINTLQKLIHANTT